MFRLCARTRQCLGRYAGNSLRPIFPRRSRKNVFRSNIANFYDSHIRSYSNTPPAVPSLPSWATTHRPRFSLKDAPRIAILGAPGSGKSQAALELSKILKFPSVDVDSDLLEGRWNCSVEEKLASLGDDQFLRAEANEIMAFLDSLPPFRIHKIHSPSIMPQIKSTILISPGLSLDTHNGFILSLSGSSVLLPEVTEALIKHRFFLVYLDCPYEIISQRLANMKVNRIVGQSTKPLKTILDERLHIYESAYDLRIPIAESATPMVVASTICDYLTINENFGSTRGWNHNRELYVEMQEVVRLGLAPDGGLFMCDLSQCKPFTNVDLGRWVNLAYPEIVLRVLERLPLGSLRPSYLRYMLYSAYANFSHPKVLPVSQLLDSLYLMETYHGPTASFKDLSLQFFPKLVKAALTLHHSTPILSSEDEVQKTTNDFQIGLLVATSGDTGPAALNGFHADGGQTPVVVLYPEDGISEVQKAQMQTAEGHVCVLGVTADFDFCQKTVKELLVDEEFQRTLQEIFPRMHLSSANSINWGRFLPQITFTVTSYLQLVENKIIECGGYVDICIPTGNFGNLLGAVLARRLGLPIRHLICASNANNILTDFIRTGIYDCSERDFYPTSSPSIDILVSSNLERFLYLLSGDPKYVRELFEFFHKDRKFKISPKLLSEVQKELKADWCTEAQCMETIHDIYTLTGKFIDPHSAVAVHVAKKYSDPSVPMLVSATADFGKFPATMLRALGEDPFTEISSSELITERIEDVNVGQGEYDLASQQLIESLNELLQIPHHVQSRINPKLIELTQKTLRHTEVVIADPTLIRHKIIEFYRSLNFRN